MMPAPSLWPDRVAAFSRPAHFRSEVELRRFVVRHAPTLIGMTVLASEYPIVTNGGGRIDALGLDARDGPIVVEFKRTATGVTICQGLYYLDWLEQHRDVFTALVANQMGTRAASRISWNAARLMCVAEEIGHREEAVARQVGRNVELLQVRRYAGGFLIVQRQRATL
jgi:RecB family endonuclease NucS